MLTTFTIPPLQEDIPSVQKVGTSKSGADITADFRSGAFREMAEEMECFREILTSTIVAAQESLEITEALLVQTVGRFGVLDARLPGDQPIMTLGDMEEFRCSLKSHIDRLTQRVAQLEEGRVGTGGV
jgi:hypothetical protein